MLISSLAVKGVIGVAALAGAVGLAHTGGSTPPSSVSSAQLTAATPAGPNAAGHGRAKARGILGRVEHGELTVATKDGDKTYDLQRGQVTSVDASSIVVTSKDGFSADYAVTSTTKVRAGKKAADIAAVHVGDQVAVLASGGDALRVRDGGASAKPGDGPAGAAGGADGESSLT